MSVFQILLLWFKNACSYDRSHANGIRHPEHSSDMRKSTFRHSGAGLSYAEKLAAMHGDSIADYPRGNATVRGVPYNEHGFLRHAPCKVEKFFYGSRCVKISLYSLHCFVPRRLQLAPFQKYREMWQVHKTVPTVRQHLAHAARAAADIGVTTDPTRLREPSYPRL